MEDYLKWSQILIEFLRQNINDLLLLAVAYMLGLDIQKEFTRMAWIEKITQNLVRWFWWMEDLWLIFAKQNEFIVH